MKYVYPAIFTEEEGGYSVLFPDLEGCYTCGDDLKDAYEMAEDVLAFTLYHYESKNIPIPAPSELNALKTKANEFVSLVLADTLGYQRMHNNKAVKKTLSIPEWLNELATENNINFSQVLQNALKEQLNVQ